MVSRGLETYFLPNNTTPLTIAALTLDPGSYVVIGKTEVGNTAASNVGVECDLVLANQLLDYATLLLASASSPGSSGLLSVQAPVTIPAGGETLSLRCYAGNSQTVVSTVIRLVAFPVGGITLQ
jgi:hypothetical protein